MSLITIEQLLESVDLDFEPRFVTKNVYGLVVVWAEKPQPVEGYWCGGSDIAMKRSKFGTLKLSEFENKPWTECIYEVPRKTTRKIELLKETTERVMLWKINELVDAVNELKGDKQ